MNGEGGGSIEQTNKRRRPKLDENTMANPDKGLEALFGSMPKKVPAARSPRKSCRHAAALSCRSLLPPRAVADNAAADPRPLTLDHSFDHGRRSGGTGAATRPRTRSISLLSTF